MDLHDLSTRVRQVEEALKPHVGLKRLLRKASASPNAVKAPKIPNLLEVFLADTKVEPINGGGRTLLLVHGIFDRVNGFAFSPLLLWGDLLGKLHARYAGRVYGYEHRTVSVDPLQNARDLLQRLPAGLEVDIICHSRGGLVVRALLEHPEVRAGLDGKGIKVGQVVFVGAANQGSDLARRENLAKLLFIFATHGAHSPNPIARLTAAASGPLMSLVQAVASEGGDLPGVAALVPGSELIHTLDASDVPLAGNPSFVRANFGNSTEPLLALLEPVSDEGFGKVLNDLVVPWSGMDNLGKRTASGRPILNIGSDSTTQGQWYHLNYLDSPRVRKFIKDRLGIA